MPFVIGYCFRSLEDFLAPKKKCGMRHPSTVRRDGDLSRLTSSSSSSSTPTSSTTSDSSSGNGDAINGNGHDYYLPGDKSSTANAAAAAENSTVVVVADLNGVYGSAAAADHPPASDVSEGGFRSSYLPAVIDPADWQSSQLSRKRKDRHDSTSSSVQHDRKLIRSNSEEFIAIGSGAGAGQTGSSRTAERAAVQHIRRVCSHEEFKRTQRTTERAATVRRAPSYLTVASGADADPAEKWANNEVQDILKETTTSQQLRSRNEISPARTRAFDFSHKIRLSPNRDVKKLAGGGGNGNGHGNGNGSSAAAAAAAAADAEAEGEHERRRSSERFCRARAPAGRKQSAKRPSKYLAARLRGGRDESVYKYDLHVSKGERRGFVSGSGNGGGHGKHQHVQQQQQRAIVGDEENNDPQMQTQQQQQHDVNDNNVNDNNTSTTIHHPLQHTLATAATASTATTAVANQSPKAKRKSDTSSTTASTSAAAAAALPWSISSLYQFDPTDAANDQPVICPRFADANYAQVHRRIEPAADFDEPPVASGALGPLAHLPHRRRSSSSSENTTSLSIVTGSSSSAWKSLGQFMKSENLKTREIMQNVRPPALGYSGHLSAALYSTGSPDERMRQTNKRLAALKRRVAGFEEAFERENGYRPSQAEKQNDRCMKNALAEMHKLRREKQLLKSDPMAAMGLRAGQGAAGGGVGVGGGGGGFSAADVAARLERVRETVQEIEVRLAEKRSAEQRSFALDELTTDQMVHEKIAVQKALVYFESLHGRPATRDERDAARDLYARYRTLKRLVNRTVSQQVSGISGVSELPTIMEHEAMQFVGLSAAVADASAGASSLAAVVAASAGALAAAMMPPASPSSAAAAAAAAAAPDSPLSELSTTESTDTTSSSVHGENVHQLSLDELWHHLGVAREQKQEMRRTIRDFEEVFEQQNGRRMLKSDRSMIEQTYAVYKQKKAKVRLLEALVKKHMAK